MKKTLITLLSIAAFSAPLSAQDDTTGPDKRDHKPPRAEGKRGKHGERPDFMSLTTEQRIALIKKRMKHNPRMAEMVTKRFDADDDGALSETELTAAAEAMAKRGGRRGGDGARERGPGGDEATERRERRGRGHGRGPRRGKRHGDHAPDAPDNDET